MRLHPLCFLLLFFPKIVPVLLEPNAKLKGNIRGNVVKNGMNKVIALGGKK